MAKSKFPQFNPYACIGDAIQWEKDGFTLTATLEDDSSTHIDEFECYTPKQIAAWRNDEWFFVGVVLSVKRGDVEILDHAASLWGVDCNFPSRRKNPNNYLSEVARELESEALEAAKSRVTEILKQLGATA